MTELSAAMGNERLPAEPGKPSPGELVDRCSQALKEAAGEEIAANAAGVIALFASITIPVDANGHSSHELAMLQPVVNRVLRWRNAAKAATGRVHCCRRRGVHA
ncbi:unnamed protein product [Effrenium voratum]|uniref:Uncharacterized protein n=1 Tax=Effrenium voratum TaxID=2562239 RepID=A0AA36NDT1_9DINO|nr:unnamed protein product [Effrenium voratum]